MAYKGRNWVFGGDEKKSEGVFMAYDGVVIKRPKGQRSRGCEDAGGTEPIAKTGEKSNLSGGRRLDPPGGDCFLNRRKKKRGGTCREGGSNRNNCA